MIITMDMETLGYFIYMDNCERAAASQKDEEDSEDEDE